VEFVHIGAQLDSSNQDLMFQEVTCAA
jgi:hypothetical protein